MRHIHVLAVLIALLAGATTYAVFKVQQVQAHQNDALRSIICRAERVVRTSPDLTAKQRRQALNFYEQSITEAHLKPCD